VILTHHWTLEEAASTGGRLAVDEAVILPSADPVGEGSTWRLLLLVEPELNFVDGGEVHLFVEDYGAILRIIQLEVVDPLLNSSYLVDLILNHLD